MPDRCRRNENNVEKEIRKLDRLGKRGHGEMEKGKKVIVCDDSSFVRRKLTDLLKTMNCEVYEASDGGEVVGVCREVNPDIIFMDIIMPETNGLDALIEIRKFNQQVKIIMLSSFGTATNLLQALKCGANDFVQKPYTTEQIAKIIASDHNENAGNADGTN
jgi:two-component system chemotaxis response regulator CheY